jgi:hypothetical protein
MHMVFAEIDMCITAVTGTWQRRSEENAQCMGLKIYYFN